MPTNRPQMVNYAIVDKTTFAILSIGRTDLESVDYIVSEHHVEYPVPDHITDDGYYYDIENGYFVPLPEKPSGRVEWNKTEWVQLDNTDEINACRNYGVFTVKQLVGQIRSKYITTIEGQEMLYLDKEREAVAFLSDPEPDLINYPFISKEIGVTATTAQELAQVWLNSAFMWRQVAAELEKRRFEVIKTISLAATKEEIETLLEQFRTDMSTF